MVELNDNLKARYADYINGKKVDLSDEELNMLKTTPLPLNVCRLLKFPPNTTVRK